MLMNKNLLILFCLNIRNSVVRVHWTKIFKKKYTTDTLIVVTQRCPND